MEYLAITLPGIEDVCATEVKGTVVAKGRVLFSELKESKSANTILELVVQCKFESLNDIVKAVDKISKTCDGSFKVKCVRSGSHLFKSVDVERVIGELLFNKGWKVDLKSPEKIFYVDIFDNDCFMGFLIKENLCRREYRVKRNNRSIDACLAFAVLQLVNYKPSELLINPFCKDAIFAVEAALIGGKNIVVADSLENNVRNALINCKMAKVSVEPKCQESDEFFNSFKEGEVDKVVTTFICGKWDKNGMQKVVNFLELAEKVVKGKVGLVSNRSNLNECLSKNLSLVEKREVHCGGFTLFIYIWKN
tara:strand:- start:28237 stop:29157 length:921 start_codon:yes stop_codon:yes gene_type:complete